MAVRDVTNLRKEGKLKEALELARQEVNEDSNEWTKSSLFWVLRDMVMKEFIPSNDTEQARLCLKQMEELLPNMMDNNGAGRVAYQNLYKQILPFAIEIKRASDFSKTNPEEAYTQIRELLGTSYKNLDKQLHESYGWILYRYLKAEGSKLTSIQIRRILRDYIQLQNDRPSLLHSMILNYAINLSKEHNDFNFYKFFLLWDAANLRNEDYQNTYIDGQEIPSLVSRICKAIIDSNEEFDLSVLIANFACQSSIIENLRQFYFWKLINLQKEHKYLELLQEFDKYAEKFSKSGASKWHSEVLNIAYRFMIDENSIKFLQFAMKWDNTGNLRAEDWIKEKNEEGKEYPSLAVKTAKKCFEVFKAAPKLPSSNDTLVWLKNLYEKVQQNEPDDDWNIRNYATICAWCHEHEKAINLYKSLLLHMGDKYYLWYELANLLTDNYDIRIGLLLKAKSLENNEDFLGDIHLELASLWQKEGYSQIAHQELAQYINHRNLKGWKISDRFHEIETKSIKVARTSIHIDFNEYIAKAEEFVYDKYNWKDYILIDKWSADNIERCNLYDGEESFFITKTKKFSLLKKSKIGDILQFRCEIVNNTMSDKCSSTGTLNTNKIIPLVTRKTNKEPWSLLPLKYGVVEYINESKHLMHVLTQDSKQTVSEYKGVPPAIESFVKFREYEDRSKGEARVRIANVESCTSEEALSNMNSRVVVVDDVNATKKVFHVVLGKGNISDIISYDQTKIRPSIGDFLRITYCIKTNKEGKKRIKFLDIQESDDECNGLKDTVQGHLELKYRDITNKANKKPDFAFVKDYYIHRNLLRKYNITSNCDVIVKIVLISDDKWKVYDIEIPQKVV